MKAAEQRYQVAAEALWQALAAGDTAALAADAAALAKAAGSVPDAYVRRVPQQLYERYRAGVTASVGALHQRYWQAVLAEDEPTRTRLRAQLDALGALSASQGLESAGGFVRQTILGAMSVANGPGREAVRRAARL